MFLGLVNGKNTQSWIDFLKFNLQNSFLICWQLNTDLSINGVMWFSSTRSFFISSHAHKTIVKFPLNSIVISSHSKVISYIMLKCFDVKVIVGALHPLIYAYYFSFYFFRLFRIIISNQISAWCCLWVC